MQPSVRVFTVDIFMCYHINFSLGEKEMCDEAEQRKRTDRKKEETARIQAAFWGIYAEITIMANEMLKIKLAVWQHECGITTRKPINFWRLSL